MKLSPALAQALTNLRGNADFKVFWEGVKEYESDRTKACIDGEGAVQLRASGAVKALQALQDAFNNAPTTLEKFKTQQGKNTQ